MWFYDIINWKLSLYTDIIKPLITLSHSVTCCTVKETHFCIFVWDLDEMTIIYLFFFLQQHLLTKYTQLMISHMWRWTERMIFLFMNLMKLYVSLLNVFAICKSVKCMKIIILATWMQNLNFCKSRNFVNAQVTCL